MRASPNAGQLSKNTNDIIHLPRLCAVKPFGHFIAARRRFRRQATAGDTGSARLGNLWAVTTDLQCGLRSRANVGLPACEGLRDVGDLLADHLNLRGVGGAEAICF